MQKAILKNTTTVLCVAIFIFYFALPAFSQIETASNSAMSQLPGKMVEYKVLSGDTLIKICSKHRKLTNHYSLTDLLSDIRRVNKLESNLLRIGQKLLIPFLPLQF